MKSSVLIVDLCNSARIPNIAVGYLVAALRNHEFDVSVFSPLSQGCRGYQREAIDTWQSHLKRRIFFSTHPATVRFHHFLHHLWRYMNRGHQLPNIRQLIREQIQQSDADVVLVSAYLDHFLSVQAICEVASSEGIPVVLGGPAFNHPNTVKEWISVPGLSAIVGAEVESTIHEITRKAIDRKSLQSIPGVYTEANVEEFVRPPLNDLSSLPIPDYSDFPWEKYDHRILPVMTGRGCSWSKCRFCSDVKSVNGLSPFRSRSFESVGEELRVLGEKHHVKSTFFVDIKLNSNLPVWHSLIDSYQSILPGGQWVGIVHVDRRKDNGLGQKDLTAARKAGMVRISCGLETGSQSLNDRMVKGTDVERIGQFFCDAKSAGISTRTTMMLGYPGETEKDLEATLDFLEEHFDHIDRIHLSRFSLLADTEFARLYSEEPKEFPGVKSVKWEHQLARAEYEYSPATAKVYRRAKSRVLDMVHQINSRQLPVEASLFNGVM